MLSPTTIKHIAVFAPAGCTGYPGTIGDTILQSSLIETLLHRHHFPALERVAWWCHPVAAELFHGRYSRLAFVPWPARDSIPPPPEGDPSFDVAIICLHDEETERAIAGLPWLAGTPMLAPDPPLSADSDIHLTRQLHSSLRAFGLHDITPAPPSLTPSQQAMATVDDELRHLGWGHEPFILCSVGAGDQDERTQGIPMVVFA